MNATSPVGTPGHGGRWATRGTVGAAVTVAAAAGVTTAHGLYEVAVAADIPPRIAWLYPLITDGLALVAYAATSRLTHAGRRYAWTVVVLAAGLSGTAQASYLAVGVHGAPGPLRFGIGAWPAVAAAIVAHLLFLLGTRSGRTTAVHPDRSMNTAPVQPEDLYTAVQPADVCAAVQPGGLTEPGPVSNGPGEHPDVQAEPRSERAGGSYGGGPARERAYEAASAHLTRNGGLPTVSELMALCEVSRGTAGAVLKDLREQRPTLHVVNDRTDRTAP